MSFFGTSNRLMDTKGYVPPQNFGVNIAKNLTFGNRPYTIVGDIYYDYSIDFTYHFLKNLRRVLSGVTGDTRFSRSEQELYNLFIKYNSDDREYHIESSVYGSKSYSLPVVFTNDVTFYNDVLFKQGAVFYENATFQGQVEVSNGYSIEFVQEVIASEFTDIELIVLKALDKWLSDEIQCLTHTKMLRCYTNENKWS